jgi:AraC-like DNA-binding protein
MSGFSFNKEEFLVRLTEITKANLINSQLGAMEILQKGYLTISETAFDCGFQSVTYFTKCFNDYYNCY